MSVKRCSFTYFVCLPIWKLKELIYTFGSSYKKVNTTLEEVSLYNIGEIHYHKENKTNGAKQIEFSAESNQFEKKSKVGINEMFSNC